MTPSISMTEVCEIFGCSQGQIVELIKAGRVGYMKGKHGGRRFFPDHLDQIKACLEVKPPEPDVYDIIGVTPRSAARWRRRDIKEGRGPR